MVTAEGAAMLEFRNCSVCGESHALQRSGAMSIHTSASGERCSEPEKVSTASAKPGRRRSISPRRPDQDSRERSEITQAFDYANEQRHTRRDTEDKPLDRRIYATRGIRTVRGGAPGLGRR